MRNQLPGKSQIILEVSSMELLQQNTLPSLLLHRAGTAWRSLHMQRLVRKVSPLAAFLAGAGALFLSSTLRVPVVAAHDEREGALHIVKDCTTNNALPGQYCVVVKSNLREIPAGSILSDGSIVHQGAIVYYDAGLTVAPAASACPPPGLGLPCPAPPQPSLNPDLRPYLDAKVVLDAGNGSWGLGRCTITSTPVGPTNSVGLCQFSDGTDKLAGFTARVTVTQDTVNPNLYHWDGTYRFHPLGDPEDHD